MVLGPFLSPTFFTGLINLQIILVYILDKSIYNQTMFYKFTEQINWETSYIFQSLHFNYLVSLCHIHRE